MEEYLDKLLLPIAVKSWGTVSLIKINNQKAVVIIIFGQIIFYDLFFLPSNMFDFAPVTLCHRQMIATMHKYGIITFNNISLQYNLHWMLHTSSSPMKLRDLWLKTMYNWGNVLTPLETESIIGNLNIYRLIQERKRKNHDLMSIRQFKS